MENESKDLIEKKQNTALANVQPLGMGHEVEPDADEVEMPRAVLIHPTSNEATAEREEDRLPVGTVVNNITKKKLSKNFIPIMRLPSVYTRWNPRKKEDPNYDSAYELGEMIFSTLDKKDPRVTEGLKFGPNGESPRVTHYINFLVYFLGENSPVLISFAKTSYKAGKLLNSNLINAGGNVFDCKFILRVSQGEKAGNKYFYLEVVADGKTTPEERALGENFYHTYKKRNIVVQPVDEETSATSKKADNAHTAVGADAGPGGFRD